MATHARRPQGALVSTFTLALAVACSDNAPTSARAPAGPDGASLTITANGSAVIDNGTLRIAVDRFAFVGVEGRFNPNDNPRDSIGLVYLPTGGDGLIVDDGQSSLGVEGWGIAAFYEPTRSITAEAHSSGFDGQRAGLDLQSFTATDNSAVSVTTIRKPSSADPFVRITHDFHPATATPNLYEVAVTFENVSDLAVSDLRYTRQAYWRINRSFTTFATMVGTAGEPFVRRATDGGAGFSPNSSARGPIVAGAVGDFTDVGPNNHGAHFDFQLGALGPGEERTIFLYYGAAAGEAEAVEATEQVNANAYALGQSQASGEPVTFILAFKGQGNAPPVAVTNGPFTISVGQTVNFSAAGSSDPDGDPITCSWDFGDGETGTGCEVSHTYTLQRSGFDVVLTVTDDEGATGTARTTVTMTAANQPPAPTLTGPEEGDVGEELSYATDATDPDDAKESLTCRINWGDGTAEAEVDCEGTPSHTYAKAGTFVIFFTARDPDNAVGEARLSVTIGEVNHPPVPTIGGPNVGEIGVELAFTTGATDPDNDTPLACAINWGEGGGFVDLANCGAGATHSFGEAGTFVVTLRARDPEGAEATVTHSVTIEEETENRAPVPVLNGPADGDVGEELTFTTSASDPDNDTPLTCEIEWGDDTGGAIPCNGTRTHTFTTAGTFTAKLTARDPDGAEGTATWQVRVEDVTPPACSPGTGARPTLELVDLYSRTAVEVITEGIPVAEMLRFSFRDPDCGPWTARIDWGDGETDEFPISEALGPGLYNTTHLYPASGRYTIRMTITDAAGLASAEQALDVDVVVP